MLRPTISAGSCNCGQKRSAQGDLAALAAIAKHSLRNSVAGHGVDACNEITLSADGPGLARRGNDTRQLDEGGGATQLRGQCCAGRKRFRQTSL